VDCAGPQCDVEKGEQQMTRIAIVEDEAAVREQLAGYVQRYTRQYGTQFEVTMFTDGVEILEDYRPAYDIIFLDVEMLHLDGMETARRIRELNDKAKSNIPIYAMTANAFEEDRQKALDAGLNGHIAKPIDIPNLMAVLKEALQI